MGVPNLTPAVELKGATIAPPGSEPLLVDVNLRLEAGECGVLLGGNGTGKTTLLRTVAGFIASPVDSVFLAGEPVKEFDPSKVGLLLEDPQVQFVMRRLEDEFKFILGNHDLSEQEIEAATARHLQEFNLEGFADRDPLSLSPGEQQQCLLAAALIHEPSVLLLDDPFQYAGRPRDQFETLRKWTCADRNMAVLLSTHDSELAMDADWVGVLADGRLQQWGRPKEVFAEPFPDRLEKPLGPWLEERLSISGTPLAGEGWSVKDLHRRILHWVEDVS